MACISVGMCMCGVWQVCVCVCVCDVCMGCERCVCTGDVCMGCEVCVCVCVCVYSSQATPRVYLVAMPSFLYSCEIKSVSGLGMRPVCVCSMYVSIQNTISIWGLSVQNSLSPLAMVYLSALTSPYRSSRFTLSPDTAN